MFYYSCYYYRLRDLALERGDVPEVLDQRHLGVHDVLICVSTSCITIVSTSVTIIMCVCYIYIYIYYIYMYTYIYIYMYTTSWLYYINYTITCHGILYYIIIDYIILYLNSNIGEHDVLVCFIH